MLNFYKEKMILIIWVKFKNLIYTKNQQIFLNKNFINQFYNKLIHNVLVNIINQIKKNYYQNLNKKFFKEIKIKISKFKIKFKNLKIKKTL